MENERKEAESRLKEIKKVLVDSDKILPIPAGMFYAIGAANIFLDIVVDKIFTCPTSSFNTQLIIALLTLVSASLFVFCASKIFVKKENEEQGRVFSKNQSFIFRIYALVLAVSISFTMGVVVMGGWALIYFYWTAAFGFAAYIAGFFTKKIISRYGMFLIIAAIVQIMAAVIYAQPLSQNNSNMSAQTLAAYKQICDFGQYSAIVLVGFGHILIGYLLGRSKNV
jgi:hypothetical protein